MKRKDIFTVNSFETDFKNRISPVYLCGMMMESASRFCEEEKISIADLSKKNITWMMAKQYIKFSSFPKWLNTVTVETWPRNKTGLKALRDFIITDEEGQEVARSVSYWILVNTVTKRLCKLEDQINCVKPVEESVMPDSFKIKVDIPSKEAEFAEKFTGTFVVRHSDIDLNYHVNSSVYIRWVLDTLPSYFHNQYKLAEISSEYMEEITATMLNDSENTVTDLSEQESIESTAMLVAEQDGKKFYHELKNIKTGRVVFRAQTLWQARI